MCVQVHKYIYIHIYIYVCVCVCLHASLVCVCYICHLTVIGLLGNTNRVISMVAVFCLSKEVSFCSFLVSDFDNFILDETCIDCVCVCLSVCLFLASDSSETIKSMSSNLAQ